MKLKVVQLPIKRILTHIDNNLPKLTFNPIFMLQITLIFINCLIQQKVKNKCFPFAFML